MAKRFYLPFTSLPRNASLGGEEYVVELWDSDHTGAATEVDGDFEALNIEWEGTSDPISPIMGSSATYRMLIRQASQMTIVTALAGSREGRFKMVVRRRGENTLYWAGWVHCDQISWPDAYYPFHLEIFATDGIARLKDIPYEVPGVVVTAAGYATGIQHVINVLNKIDLYDVGVWKEDVLRITSWWYADHMDTLSSNLEQVNIDYARFFKKMDNGTSEWWNCWAVIEAICQAFNCQFLFANGMFHIRSIDQYKLDTQRAFYYGDNGALNTVVAAENLDRVVNYSSATGMKKLNGGRYTFLPPLKKVCVDYKHVTSDNKANGLAWARGDEPYRTIATIFNPVVGYTNFLIKIKIQHITNLQISPAGSAAWPPHRFIWNLNMRITKAGGGWLYLQRTITGSGIGQILPNETSWGTTQDGFQIYGSMVDLSQNEAFVTSEWEFTTKTINWTLTEQDADIQFQLELNRIEKLDGTTLVLVGSPPYIGDYNWKTVSVWVSANREDTGISPDNETLRYCAENTGKNTEERLLTTYLGDGPSLFSVSTLKQVGALFSGQVAENWQVNNTGPIYYLSRLLAIKVLQFRKLPQQVYQGTFLHPDIEPYERFVDGEDKYIATRISLSAASNQWEGEFVRMDVGDTNDITTPEPWTPPIKEPTTPGGYPSPPPPDTLPPPTNSPTTEIMTGVSGWVAQSTNNVTALSADRVAGTNPTITITPVDYQAFKKGDQVALINGGNGDTQYLTVTTTYQPNATTLALTGTLARDVPAGSLIKLAKKTEMQVRGFSHYHRGFTGEFWTIPTTVGTLPNPVTVGADEIRRRVKVFRNGVRLVYDANNFPECFGIKPATNEIEFYYKVRGETVFLEVT